MFSSAMPSVSMVRAPKLIQIPQLRALPCHTPRVLQPRKHSLRLTMQLNSVLLWAVYPLSHSFLLPSLFEHWRILSQYSPKGGSRILGYDMYITFSRSIRSIVFNTQLSLICRINYVGAIVIKKRDVIWPTTKWEEDGQEKELRLKVLPGFEPGFREYVIKIPSDNHYTIAPCLLNFVRPLR